MAEAPSDKYSSTSSTVQTIYNRTGVSENDVVPPLESGPHSKRGRDRPQNKTEATFSNRSNSSNRQHGSSMQNSDKPKAKQNYRRKGTRPDSRSELVKGTTDDHSNLAGKESGEQTVKKVSGTAGSGNESERKLPGKFPRKGKKENPGNPQTSSGSQSGRSRRTNEKSSFKKKVLEKPTGVMFSHEKTSVKSQEMPKLLQEPNYQQKPFGINKDSVNHGSVSDGVYRRKDKAPLKQNYGHRQNQTNMIRKDKHRDNISTPKKTIEPSGFVKKPAEAINAILKVSASENQRLFNKTSQSSMQASVLIEQLTDEKYECMVCCDVVRCSKAVWCCSKCYHIFHLSCIQRWAKSPTAVACDGVRSGWRCPACQFIESNSPNIYTCFCGKVEEPKWYPQDGITPHSCGELCLKERTGKQCPHPCNQLCHPGPCPSCPVTITKKCCCGKTTSPVRCGKPTGITCSSVCGKDLNCGIHGCEDNCHLGGCKKCDVITEQYCYCGKITKDVVCGTGTATYISGKPGYFTCGTICSKKLDCGNHECDQICHPSECNACVLQPSIITQCPCGKKKITELLNGSNRTSCLDLVPTCKNPCNCHLPCAKYNDMIKTTSDHRCKKLCHRGDCSNCECNSIVKCRCRATSKKMPCVELSITGEPYLCELQCNKLKECLRHRCNEKCCVGRLRETIHHPCDLICGKRLKCGKHRCSETCHPFEGCPPCLMAGFEEVFCHCGNAVQEPPIPCGVPRPICYSSCSRIHPCQHEVQHTCHYEEECPPCTVFVSRWCMGEHKLRDNIPCYIDCVSCGEECRKTLPCGKHSCRRMCHKSPCLEENGECKQSCTTVRKSCGHPCHAPCHEGDCPRLSCKSKIRIHCKCGRKSGDSVCLKGGDTMEAAQAYQRFTTKNLAEKIKGLQDGESVDISGLMSLNEKKEQLDCDERCAKEQRNRALAEALDITPSDGTTRNDVVQFPHFLEEHAKANMKLLYFVEDAFENLVKAVLKVQSPTLTHSFASMNKKNRHFIHELSTLYGCTSMSYDQEPNRNTVVTATKNSTSPRMKLSSHIQRQVNPQPPPPIPVLPDQGIGDARFIPRKPQERNVVDYFEDNF